MVSTMYSNWFLGFVDSCRGECKCVRAHVLHVCAQARVYVCAIIKGEAERNHQLKTWEKGHEVLLCDLSGGPENTKIERSLRIYLTKLPLPPFVDPCTYENKLFMWISIRAVDNTASAYCKSELSMKSAWPPQCVVTTAWSGVTEASLNSSN